MARLIIFTLALFAVMFISVNAIIDCCKYEQQCLNACSAQHCAYMLCCKSNSCTVGGQTIGGCQCTCANCPNAALVASGLLGTKFAPANLLGDEAIKIAKV
uniref:Uncharacterized protein n=1 Tax=Panagrolaimus davidi TaxID=227884 RepID=A0A914R435_9BILA